MGKSSPCPDISRPYIDLSGVVTYKTDNPNAEYIQMQVSDILAIGTELPDLGFTLPADGRLIDAAYKTANVTVNSTSVPPFDPAFSRSAIYHMGTDIGSAIGYQPFKTNLLGTLFDFRQFMAAVWSEPVSELYVQARLFVVASSSFAAAVVSAIGSSTQATGLQYCLKLDPSTGTVEVLLNDPTKPDPVANAKHKVIPPIVAQTVADKDLVRGAYAAGGALGPVKDRSTAGSPETMRPSPITVHWKLGAKGGSPTGSGIGRVRMWAGDVLIHDKEYVLNEHQEDIRFATIAGPLGTHYLSEMIVTKASPVGMRVRSLPAAGPGQLQQGVGNVPNQLDDKTPQYVHDGDGDVSTWTQAGIPGGYRPLAVQVAAIVQRETTPAFGVDLPEVQLITRLNNQNYGGVKRTVGPERQVIKQMMGVSPETGVAWEPYEVNNMQIGLRSTLPGST